MDLQRDEQRAHRIVYRLAWMTARGKPVLTGAVARDCQRVIEQAYTEHGWTILTLNVRPVHVALLIQVWPHDSAFEVLKACKRATAHELRARHKKLLRLPSIWTRTYVAVTEGQLTPPQLERWLTQLHR